MTLADKIALSWSNLGRRKVRTALTSIGVIVGIITVVMMVSLVNGVQLQVKAQFEKIGLDRVVARPATDEEDGFSLFGLDERTKLITPVDVQRWKTWPEAQSVRPEIEMPWGLVSKLRWKEKSRPVRIAGLGSMHRGLFADPPVAVAGTIEPPEKGGAIVLSRGVLKSMGVLPANSAALIGQTVEVILEAPRGEKQIYRLQVCGVSSQGAAEIQIATRDRLAMKSWWLDEDDVLETDGYDAVTLRAADVGQAKILVERLRKEKFQVQSIDAILDVANRIFAVITAMLAMASSIALFVACIGIVNTMIMSIYERTREIGTLKAMGASRGDIRVLFMLEAGMIGLIGGTVGLVLSWLLGLGLNRLAVWFTRHRDWPLPDNLFVITPSLALAALLLALLIGVLAGLYPANRAARLDPLAALRHE